MSYDPEKKSEYQFRLVASVVIFAMLIYVTTTHGLRGPALFEIGLFGGAFATLSFCHSIWALWKIRTQDAIKSPLHPCGGENYILNTDT